MSEDKTNSYLNDPDAVALAYTVKVSKATTLEQFVDELIENTKSLEELKKLHKGKWLI